MKRELKRGTSTTVSRKKWISEGSMKGAKCEKNFLFGKDIKKLLLLRLPLPQPLQHWVTNYGVRRDSLCVPKRCRAFQLGERQRRKKIPKHKPDGIRTTDSVPFNAGMF